MINFRLQKEERTKDIDADLRVDDDKDLLLTLNGTIVAYIDAENGRLILTGLNYEEQLKLEYSGIEIDSDPLGGVYQYRLAVQNVYGQPLKTTTK